MQHVQMQGRWQNLRWNTIQATMDANRRGVFFSSSVIRNNINTDIGTEWVRLGGNIVTQILEGKLLAKIENLREIVNSWMEAPEDVRQFLDLEVRSLQDRLGHVRMHYFSAQVCNTIRQHFTVQQVYSWGRRQVPRFEEFVQVVQLLLQNSVGGLQQLRQASLSTVTFFQRVVAPIDALAPQHRSQIELILAPAGPNFFRQEVENPVDFRDVISGEMMRNPVEIECGHVFDRDHIVRWIEQNAHPTCPVDRRRLQNPALLVPRIDFLRAIQEWQQRHPDEEAEVEWWTIVAEYLPAMA